MKRKRRRLGLTLLNDDNFSLKKEDKKEETKEGDEKKEEKEEEKKEEVKKHNVSGEDEYQL